MCDDPRGGKSVGMGGDGCKEGGNGRIFHSVFVGFGDSFPTNSSTKHKKDLKSAMYCFSVSSDVPSSLASLYSFSSDDETFENGQPKKEGRM